MRDVRAGRERERSLALAGSASAYDRIAWGRVEAVRVVGFVLLGVVAVCVALFLCGLLFGGPGGAGEGSVATKAGGRATDGGAHARVANLPSRSALERHKDPLGDLA